MLKKDILLKEFKQVQEFNNICFACPYDVDIIQGKYLVNAKSIMGIFSLDISKPIVLVLDAEDEKELDKFSEYFI